MSAKKPWDAEVDATRTGLERLMRALLVVGGHFTDSFSLAPVTERPSRVTVWLRVHLPEGAEERFRELAHLGEVRLRPPQKAHL